MKLLATVYSTLTTSRVCAGHCSLGENRCEGVGGVKSVYTLFFFMPLFTGSTSSAITSYALSQELCKNHKCQCPLGPHSSLEGAMMVRIQDPAMRCMAS